MDRINDIKAQVAEELGKGTPDWQRIERLSRGEVDADPSRVRFSVDAGHIQQLGLELVSKQDTALAELIKNAYDADATRVSVNFSNHDSPGGALVIEDNGTGMTADIVRDAWMCISTFNKHEAPISPRYGRQRAGRKGIGRFAVQRLGKKLVLETEVAGTANGVRVTFDWDQEFQPGKSLNDAFSLMEEYQKPVERERTRLNIVDLREAWSESLLQRAWRAVLLLQPPFPVSQRRSCVSGIEHELDPGFEVVINGVSSRAKNVQLSMYTNMLEHALAEITGEILHDGTAYVQVSSRILDLDEKQTFERKFLLTGALSFSAKYFIYKSEVLSGISSNMGAEIGRKYGGVRIYRNGFRVQPYGEQSDDWLELDRDVARRALLVPGNNQNFFGQVELDGQENILLEETSSREGLIENEAFLELKYFIRSGVEWAIKRVAAVRERKQSAGQKDFVSTARPRKPSEVLTNLVREISGTDGSGLGQSAFSLPAEKLAVIDLAQNEMVQWEIEQEKREAELFKYEEMLRVLASLGISISIFGHEIKGVRDSVSAHLSLLDDKVTAIGDVTQKEGLERTVASLNQATSRMFDLGAYIDGLMSSTGSRKMQQLSVKGAIERFVEQFRHYMERQKVVFEVDISPANLRTVEMHASEVDAVLLNCLTNAIKSMKIAKVYPRRVRIFAHSDGEHVLIGFEDNGGGVPPEIAHRIFDAFYTTTLGTDDDAIAGPGTGLGLKIVSDIATSYGGSASLGSPSEGYNFCLEFRVLSAQARRK